MDTGDEEEAFIAALQLGDVVMHPVRREWMRVVDIKEGVATDTLYETDPKTGLGKEPRVSHEPYRRLGLDRLDRDPWETPIPYELYYRDIERRITRKRRARRVALPVSSSQCPSTTSTLSTDRTRPSVLAS